MTRFATVESKKYFDDILIHELIIDRRPPGTGKKRLMFSCIILNIFGV